MIGLGVGSAFVFGLVSGAVAGLVFYAIDTTLNRRRNR